MPQDADAKSYTFAERVFSALMKHTTLGAMASRIAAEAVAADMEPPADIRALIRGLRTEAAMAQVVGHAARADLLNKASVVLLRKSGTGGGSESAVDRMFSAPATDARAERLALLMEDCAEVVHAIAKIQRHGWDSNWNGRLAETNAQALERELGDLLVSLDMVFDKVRGDVSYLRALAVRSGKIRKLLGGDGFIHCQENVELLKSLYEVPTGG